MTSCSTWTKDGNHRERSRRDAFAYIERRLAEPPLAAAMASWPSERRRAFAAKVNDAGSGNFLFLHHFLNEALQHALAGRVEIEALRVPRGIDEESIATSRWKRSARV